MKKLSYKQKYEITKCALGFITITGAYVAIFLNYLEKVGIINVC